MDITARVFILVLTLVALTFVLRLVRRRQMRSKYAVLWLFVAAILLILGVFPLLLDRISEAVGIAYPPALLFLAALILLFMVVIQFSWEISRLEDRTRTLAEEVALLRGGIQTGVEAPDSEAARKSGGDLS
jgi:hypothetical protein